MEEQLWNFQLDVFGNSLKKEKGQVHMATDKYEILKTDLL